MIKLALMAGTTAWHGFTFSGLVNRIDGKAFEKNDWPVYRNAFARRARITHAWSTDVKGTRKLAQAAGIEHVVKYPEDVIGEVDGVILADDMEMTHHRSAPIFLKAGLPTFIDKPLAPNWREAKRTVELARKHRAPMMSCSALRYATEIADGRAIAAKVGRITTCVAVGVNELYFYGIHPLELMVTVMGKRIRKVRNVGEKGKSIVHVTFTDGRMGTLIVYEKGLAYTLEITLHGTKGHLHLPIADHQGFYADMMRTFLDMVETRRPPIPYDETLNIIRALELAKRSQKTGRACEV